MPLYRRFLAWTRLLKLWGTLRSDDLEGLVPDRLVLTSSGLEGVLERSKTSGPGKKNRYLPVFIDRRSFITVPNWLETGYEILRHPKFNFARDYLLPRPSADYEGTIRARTTYLDRSALGRALLLELFTPVFDERGRR